MDNPNQKNTTMTFKDCGASELGRFITALERNDAFERKMYQPISEKVHFERFNYQEGNNKISVVYDTKAKMLSVTAKDETLNKLKDMYNGNEVKSEVGFVPKAVPKTELVVSARPKNNENKTNNQKTVQPQLKVAAGQNQLKPNLNQRQNQNSNVQQGNKKQGSQWIELKPNNNVRQESNPSNHKQELKPNNQKKELKPNNIKKELSPNVQKQVLKPNNYKQELKPNNYKKEAVLLLKANEAGLTKSEENISLEYKNGFSLKNYSEEAFKAALQQIRELKGIAVVEEPEENNNGIKIHVYKIEDKKKQKLFLRYLPTKQNVQMQGKQSAMYHDIQMLLFKGTDFKTAITSYIKQTGEDKKASTLEKQLKKLIPYAYDYLSDQAKQYLTIAFMDINNEETRLSDYSALMVSPYRGLERLIYDLQIAKDIEVKMIGQAYEKISEGKYTLKQGYRKRIMSLVYNEVMSDLYQEYFEKRNFYLHSDNSINSQMRVIKNKDEAKKIYSDLLEIINYNYKKLQEINFTFKK